MTGSPRCGQPSPMSSAARACSIRYRSLTQACRIAGPVGRGAAQLGGGLAADVAFGLAAEQFHPLGFGLFRVGQAPVPHCPGRVVQRQLGRDDLVRPGLAAPVEQGAPVARSTPAQRRPSRRTGPPSRFSSAGRLPASAWRSRAQVRVAGQRLSSLCWPASAADRVSGESQATELSCSASRAHAPHSRSRLPVTVAAAGDSPQSEHSSRVRPIASVTMVPIASGMLDPGCTRPAGQVRRWSGHGPGRPDSRTRALVSRTPPRSSPSSLQ